LGLYQYYYLNTLFSSKFCMSTMLVKTPDIVSLLLLRLTPKEAAPLTASCKALHAQKKDVASKCFDVIEYAMHWRSEYDKMFVSRKYSMESIAKCLISNYPYEKLSKISLVMSNYQWLVATNGNSAETYISEIKISFFEQKNSPRKAKAIYCYSYTLFNGTYSELPEPFVVLDQRT
jgi:hypothetical protein